MAPQTQDSTVLGETVTNNYSGQNCATRTGREQCFYIVHCQQIYSQFMQLIKHCTESLEAVSTPARIDD